MITNSTHGLPVHLSDVYGNPQVNSLSLSKSLATDDLLLYAVEIWTDTTSGVENKNGSGSAAATKVENGSGKNFLTMILVGVQYDNENLEITTLSFDEVKLNLAELLVTSQRSLLKI